MQTLLKLVLHAGANPNSQQQRGYTALHEAAMHNSVERAQVLLEAGADAAIKSDEGQTAADMAAQSGNTGSVRDFAIVSPQRRHRIGYCASTLSLAGPAE